MFNSRVIWSTQNKESRYSLKDAEQPIFRAKMRKLFNHSVNDKIFAFSLQVYSFPLCFVMFCLRLYVPLNNLSVLSNGDEVSFLTSCPG